SHGHVLFRAAEDAALRMGKGRRGGHPDHRHGADRHNPNPAKAITLRTIVGSNVRRGESPRDPDCRCVRRFVFSKARSPPTCAALHESAYDPKRTFHPTGSRRLMSAFTCVAGIFATGIVFNR